MPNEYPPGSLVDSPATLATEALLEDLRDAGVAFDTATAARADHGRDWWPLTIPDVARGRVPRWPGVVVRPTSSEDVSRVLTIASTHHVAVTAQGGRSSVVGGAVAPEGAIALDLTGLDRVLDIDVSREP
jgi:FAD/FMN-containing dehydrogenase